MAEEVAPPVIMQLLSRQGKRRASKVAAIHPPEYGHWRKAMLEDIAITTGGRVISRDLGGKLEKAELHDLGAARQVRVSSSKTLITAGKGDPRKVNARREQVMRQYEAAPENIERDKFQERIAKLSGGTAMILAGGATPVEQKRRTQLIEDAINATRAAIEEGIVPGGGIALLKAASRARSPIKGSRAALKTGAELLQRRAQPPSILHRRQRRVGWRSRSQEGRQGEERSWVRRAQRRLGRYDRVRHHRSRQSLL